MDTGTAIQGSVSLVLSKFDELIRAVGGRIEAFYPFVVKQVIIVGVVQIVLLVLSFLALVFGLPLLLNKNNWEEKSYSIEPNSYGVIGIILCSAGGVILLFSTVNFCVGGFYLLNPDYFAVKDIIEMGKELIK